MTMASINRNQTAAFQDWADRERLKSAILREPKWLSGSRTIRPTAILNDSTPLRIDLDSQHVVNLLIRRNRSDQILDIPLQRRSA